MGGCRRTTSFSLTLEPGTAVLDVQYQGIPNADALWTFDRPTALALGAVPMMGVFGDFSGVVTSRPTPDSAIITYIPGTVAPGRPWAVTAAVPSDPAIAHPQAGTTT